MAVSDAAPTPQMVGNAFVEQYYSILHQEPGQVHRFYHESSVISRPEKDGAMTNVTTIAEINKKILSLDYKSFRVEILSADAQPSHMDGVMVVVTGCLTGSDNLKRKFAQSFFLAPQDKGYFVLNDVFRYVDEYKSIDIESVPANDDTENAPKAAFTSEPEPDQVPEDIPPSQTVVVDTDTSVSKEVSQPLENGKLSVTENVIPVNHVKESSSQENHPDTEKAASNTQEDAPKKSFASIVNALKENAAPFHVRTSPVKPVEQPRVASIPAPEAPAPSTDSSPVEKNNDNAGKAYAIFVANLPMNATVEQLERVFKKFGPIKHDGIQVRSNKQQGSCFGFVEFESAASMQSALEASPVILDNRRLSIEERRANNDRARYPSGRGGYRNDRNDSFRGRGNFGGGRGGGGGYANRNDFEKRGEFSGRPRGGNNNGRSNGEAVPSRNYQNGGRVPRQPVKVQ